MNVRSHRRESSDRRGGAAVWLLLPLFLLPGCGRHPLKRGLNDRRLIGLVERCEALITPRRGWCAYSIVSSLDPRTNSGQDMVPICLNISTEAPRDQCIAHVMRIAPIPPAETCDRIEDTRLRSSCWLDASDFVAAQAGDLGEVLAVCAETGELLQHCLVHFTTRSAERWRVTGPTPFLTELRYIVGNVDGVGEMEHFGMAVGAVGAQLGFPPEEAGPCEQFPVGTSYEACRRTLSTYGMQEGR